MGENTKWGDRLLTLADFAEEVDVAHYLTARRIPVVRDCYSRWKYHVALVIGGPDYMPREHDALEPEPFEVEQLCVYLEKHMRYYNASYRARVTARGPFDVDGTVNTHTLRKNPVHGWQYHAASWQYGPTWVPDNVETATTLEAVLDRINTFGDGPPMQSWLDLKAESGAFGYAVAALAKPGDA